MNNNVKLINKDTHKKTKILPRQDFAFAKKNNQTIISLSEFYQAAKSQPIVFLKGGDGKLFASAILGFKPEQNVFINEDNQWSEREYIPAFFRRYPFIFVQNNDTLALGIDTDSELINESEGNALFDEEGNTTDYTNQTVEFLNVYHQSNMQTINFVTELDELGLLEDASVKLSATDNGDNIEFKGFKKVSEEKLKELSDEQLLKLVKNGAYKYITIHLASLLNFENIALLEKVTKA